MTSPTARNKIEAAVDSLTTAAGTALATQGDGFSRKVAVQQLATGEACQATARLAANAGADFNGAAELGYAHQIIAELAARLAEQQPR